MNLFKRGAYALAAGFAAAAMITGGAASAATYVDTGLGNLKPEDRVVVANPQPVQLLFTFKTKGAANARATKELKKRITDAVAASGLFSEVVDGPAANGAVVSISLDNIPQDGATSAGFVTGLTFGLKGSTVSDYYVCTVEYLGSAQAEKLTKIGKHALHTTIGMAAAPPNGVKAKNIVEAVYTMTDQIVANTLNDLGKDPAFAGAPAAVQDAATPPTPPPATAPEAAPPVAAEPAKSE